MSEEVKTTENAGQNALSVQEQLAASQVMMQQQMAQAQMMQQQTQQQMLLQMQKKNMAVAILLSLLFGPLGLFYATVMGGAIMIVVLLVIGVMTWGFGLIAIPSILLSYHNPQKFQQYLEF